jgi:hypothetical protein
VLLFYCNPSCASILTISYHYMRTKIHVPKSPAEMQQTRLWTLITFFWLGIFMPNLTKILIYMYIAPCRSLLLFGAVLKKKHLLRIPSSITYYISQILSLTIIIRNLLPTLSPKLKLSPNPKLKLNHNLLMHSIILYS